MDDFKSMIRDTLPINNPSGTWQWGKNFLLTKGYKSISNEDGIKFQYLIKGTVIGFIATNYHIVYFHKNDTGTDEIGVVNTNSDIPNYITIIKDNQLNFQLNCPIEGIFVYNYKEDLIVSWCDGIYSNSNTPKVLNLTTLPFAVNGDKTLVNSTDFNKVHMFIESFQGEMEIKYLSVGNIEGESCYITFSYILKDDSLVRYFSTSYITSLEEEDFVANNYSVVKRGLKLLFTDLDTNFNKIKIGLVVNEEGVLKGYESIIISYTGSSLEVLIQNLSNFTETSAETIFIDTAIFEKVNTLTIANDKSYLGNVVQKDRIPFQKYANLLKLTPYKYPVERLSITGDAISNRTFMYDEVYAIYIELQFLTGEYSEAFHIPGETASADDLLPLTPSQKTQYDLTWTDTEIIGFKQFHIINKGFIDANLSNESSNIFGIWYNEETYPNTDEYDSTLDYEGNALSSEDNRNTPIRYHRIPTKIGVNVPTYVDFPNFTIVDGEFLIGVKLINFGTIVPSSIKNLIQGYRLSFVKRELGSTYVAGNWLMSRREDREITVNSISTKYSWYNYNLNNLEFTSGSSTLDGNFNKTRVIAPELFKYSPSLNVSYIKANTLSRYGNLGMAEIDDKYRFVKVTGGLKYRPGNSIIFETPYLEQGVDMDITHTSDYFPMLDGQPIGAFLFNSSYREAVIDIIAFTHNIDLYKGLKSNSLVVIGRTSILNNNIKFKGGDVFSINYGINLSTVTLDVEVILIRSAMGGSRILSPLNQVTLKNEDLIPTGTTIQITGTIDPIADTITGVINVISKEGANAILDKITILTSAFFDNYISTFPYRVYKGINIPSEGNPIVSLKTFLVNSYYDMPNTKGEIIALRGKENILFIQHRFSLFITAIKDVLRTENIDAYLGVTELFDRVPEELLGDDKGYIGCTSKFTCTIVKGMYITVNQINGQIFIIQQSIKEISDKGNKRWFWDNWDNGLDYYNLDSAGEKRRIDNPFISVGHLVGYDKEYNRLLFIKKMYNFIGSPTGTTFDGEFYTRAGNKLEFNNTNEFNNVSRTLSFNLETKNWSWIAEHDYHPNLIFYTNSGLFSITNKINGTDRASVYEHNDKLTKGFYYGVKYDTYVDLIFNNDSRTSRLFMNITWITDVINNSNGNERDKTITHIMIYNNNQCSGIINLKDNHFDLTRNIEGDWNFNEFRDLVINPNNPILDSNGDIILSNINNIKLWFEKSNFIGKFITVRLLIDNIDNDTVYIHKVNVNSLISNR